MSELRTTIRKLDALLHDTHGSEVLNKASDAAHAALHELDHALANEPCNLNEASFQAALEAFWDAPGGNEAGLRAAVTAYLARAA